MNMIHMGEFAITLYESNHLFRRKLNSTTIKKCLDIYFVCLFCSTADSLHFEIQMICIHLVLLVTQLNYFLFV